MQYYSYYRRLQGCVKNTFNIDGRTKIAELDKFVKDLLAANKKIVGTFALLISESCADSYKKFCDEFVKDQRAGISNVTDTVQVYLIPPALKNAIHILQPLALENVSNLRGHGLLYGVIVGKAPGPTHITERNHAVVPFGKSNLALFFLLILLLLLLLPLLLLYLFVVFTVMILTVIVW